jgi:hypothetical protein
MGVVAAVEELGNRGGTGGGEGDIGGDLGPDMRVMIDRVSWSAGTSSFMRTKMP